MSENTDINYPYSYSPQRETAGRTHNIIAEVRSAIAPYRFTVAAKGIVDELGISQESNVLELGSGLGLLGNAIKKNVGTPLKYIGLDLVFNSVKESEKKGLLSIQTEITHLPLEDRSFDFIVTTDVLEHVPNAESVVSEISRVLKPGGKGFIVIADPSEAGFENVTQKQTRIRLRFQPYKSARRLYHSKTSRA